MTFPDYERRSRRNHASRPEVMSSCSNYSATNHPNNPDRNHGSCLEVMSDGKRWRDFAVPVSSQTESQGKLLIVKYIPYAIVAVRACTVTAFPDYERRSRKRIACCSSGRDKLSLPPPRAVTTNAEVVEAIMAEYYRQRIATTDSLLHFRADVL